MPPRPEGSGVVLLKGLKKFTQYGIVVQAFNEKGPGPLSNEIFAQTSEDGKMFLILFFTDPIVTC